MTFYREEVNFVRACPHRVAILERVVSGPATPSRLARDTEYSLSYVSLGLGELRERGLVELLVPDDRKKGRLYGSTDRGTTVWETIEAEQRV